MKNKILHIRIKRPKRHLTNAIAYNRVHPRKFSDDEIRKLIEWNNNWLQNNEK